MRIRAPVARRVQSKSNTNAKRSGLTNGPATIASA
jgi:hypothetical protein